MLISIRSCISLIGSGEDVSISRALNQATRYLERAWELSHDAALRAYLIVGSQVYRIRMNNGRGVYDLPFNMFDSGDPFTAELCESTILLEFIPLSSSQSHVTYHVTSLGVSR